MSQSQDNKIITPSFCSYCHSTSLQISRQISKCLVCDKYTVYNPQVSGEFLCLHVGKRKYVKDMLACWIKVVEMDKPYKPILFPYPSQKVDDLGIKSGDILYISFPESIFSSHSEVEFAPRPEQLDYIRSELVDLSLSIKLEDVWFGDDKISARVSFGEETMIKTSSGFNLRGYRGDLYPVKTALKSLGARKIYVNVPEHIWKIYNPDFDLSYYHNQIKDKLPIEQQKEVAIEVFGKFRVYYNLDETVTLSSTEDLVVTRTNMMNLKKLVEDDILEKRWREVRKQIRELLSLKATISVEELTQIMKDNKIPVENIDEAAKSLSWHSSYDETYFDHIKSICNNMAYFSQRGYFFSTTDGRTIWEIPKTGAATYVFKGSPQEILAKLGDLSRTEIIDAKQKLPETMAWYVGRVIHRSEDQWKEDLEDLLE